MAGSANRFDIRPDREGWTVYDLWTGEAVVIALVPQTGMPEQDAKELADMINSGRMGRTSEIWQ